MSRSNPRVEKRTITDVKQRMTWGKFSGETVQEILDNESQYILWLDANTDVEIASHILTLAEDAMKPDHPFKGYTSRWEKAGPDIGDGDNLV